MISSKLSINLVTWNGIKYIADCLDSIQKQTFKDYNVLIIDNGSNDGTVDFIKKNYPKIPVIKNFKNLGFAKAHNQGIKYSNSQYVLVLNQDIVLTPIYLAELMKVLENNEEVSCVSGKLLKIRTLSDDLGGKIKTNIIDSTGLKMFKNRKVINRGMGEEDINQYNNLEEVFGLSATALLIRRDALNTIRISDKNRNIDEFFDEDFFSYKEDVDLSWRLQLLGWKSLYVPWAIAYHYRSASSSKETVKEIIKNRRRKSDFVNRLSYKNHLFTLLKNEHKINLLKNLPSILFYESKKFIFLMFIEPQNLYFSLKEFFKQLSRIMIKRKINFSKIKVDSNYINKWFY